MVSTEIFQISNFNLRSIMYVSQLFALTGKLYCLCFMFHPISHNHKDVLSPGTSRHNLRHFILTLGGLLRGLSYTCRGEEQCQSLESPGNKGFVLPTFPPQQQRVNRKMKPWLEIAINLWILNLALIK